MKYILSGTNRPGSRSLQVAHLVCETFRELGETYEILDLVKWPVHLLGGEHYGQTLPPEVESWVEKINTSEAVVVIVPEYNGSMPGILKYFIDFWKYPESFEHRPFCLIGLGGTFGGLRPVEHLQQVLNYRNAFVFPERVFLTNVWNVLKDGQITDPKLVGLLKTQAQNFTRFLKALENF